MKRVAGLLLTFILLCCVSCEKGHDNEPEEFDIYGKWGVTDVTYTYPDRASVYMEERDGHYYEYWTFQVNGVLIVKYEPHGDTKYGDFVYYENKKQINYLFEGNRRSINATIVELSPTKMRFIADLQEVGQNIYTMKKIAW